MEEKGEAHTQARLLPLITIKAVKQREFTRRKDQHIFQAVHSADVAKFEADGWVLVAWAWGLAQK